MKIYLFKQYVLVLHTPAILALLLPVV